MNDEIVKQLKMTYDELCKYLQGKYGLPVCDYFTNEKCVTKPKRITRTSDGLLIHHIAERINGTGPLSNPYFAKRCPFEYQRKENLTFCNYIEHLILHLKINAERYLSSEFTNLAFANFFRTSGLLIITLDINLLFKSNGSTVEWKNNCYLVIKPFISDYVSILKGTLCFLENYYPGDKEKNKDRISTEKESCIKDMCSNYDGSVWDELLDKLTKPFTEEEKQIACWIKESVS